MISKGLFSAGLSVAIAAASLTLGCQQLQPFLRKRADF
jgi:hypothetical protein